MSAELRVTAEPVGETDERAVVRFAGEVDMTNVDRFRAALSAATSAAPTVVADLDGITYLDSAGVEALFATARATRLAVVAGPACVVRRVLDVVGLAEVADLSDGAPS
jgi:anti-sigma B factor antagonist